MAQLSFMVVAARFIGLGRITTDLRKTCFCHSIAPFRQMTCDF